MYIPASHLVLQAFLHRHIKIPHDGHIHSLVPQLSTSELLHPCLMLYQRLTWGFVLLINIIDSGRAADNLCPLSVNADNELYCCVAEGLFHAFSSVPQSRQDFAVSKWNITGEDFGNKWPLIGGSGATWATKTLTKTAALFPGTQTNYLFKKKAPSSDQLMVRTPDPAHIITPTPCLSAVASKWDSMFQRPVLKTISKTSRHTDLWQSPGGDPK